MKRFITHLFLTIALLAQYHAEAQSVRRSVIASIGDAGDAGGIYISCTVGQPPNAGTIENGGVIFRQGFQQPLSKKDISAACADAPQALFTVDKTQDVCGEKFNFTYADVAEPGTTFFWDFGQDAFSPTSVQQNPKGIVYSSAGTKIVTLIVTTGNCTFSTIYNVGVNGASFGAYAQGSDVVCADDKTGSIALTTLNGVAPYKYKWGNGATTASLSSLSPGTYSFTVTDATGCPYSSQGVVGSPDSIAITGFITVESCDDTKDGAIAISVAGGISPYKYQWSNGSSSEDLNNISGGAYVLTVTDAANCHKNLELTVTTVCEGFEFNNLITPNGDGANDEWVVSGIQNFPNNELEIFNRWGEQVYYKKNYDNSWRGTNESGKALPAGPYYFILRLNDVTNIIYSGSISVLR